MVSKTALFLLLAAAVVVSGCTQQQNVATLSGGNAITIKDYSFNPSQLSVKAGTTVTWTNMDAASHSIRSDTFSSDVLGTGGTFGYTFTAAGTYSYHCGVHPYMTGTIVVTG